MIKALIRTASLSAAVIALSVLAGAGATARAADAAPCLEAAECHGPLPQICKQCRGGHSACAHWACVRHQCVIRICGREK